MVLARSKDIVGCAVILLRQSKNERYKQNNANTLLTALPHYNNIVQSVNCNYAITSFLWHRSAYAILPVSSAGGLTRETT